MNSRSEITMNGINKRKSRPNAPRGGRSMGRGGGFDKSVFQGEGVYKNSRLTHVASSIVGCVVLVEVKSGDKYEGVLRTFSPNMEIALGMTHKIEESCQNSVPSKDHIIENMVFPPSDVVTLTALNVDLEYATKESFIDSAISNKYNGQAGEKELQPWDGEISMDSGALEAIDSPSAADNSNGWDPNEMFKTNAERFDVKSSYDPSLSQYTTPLKQENTDEYKKREAQAAKIAQEIERSESYKHRIALEIGDGDEEEKFSAVVRSGEQGNTPGKYVPPHLRKNPQQGRATRTAPQGIPGSGRSSVSSVSSPQPSPTQHSAPVELDSNLSADKEEGEKISQLVTDGEPSGATVEKEATPPVVVSKSIDRKPVPSKARDEQIKELKQFSTDFKLQSEEKKRMSPAQSQHALASPSPTTPSSAESVSSITQPSPSPQRGASPATPTAPAAASPPVSAEDKADKEDEKLTDTLKKSTLNPNAKEFVWNPNAKPFQPKQPIQVATPPRPATQQSPVMAQHMTAPMPGAALYGSYVVPVSMTMTPNVVQQTQQPRFDRKRAVVSVQPRPDFNAQAAAATGAPLLAQPTAIQQSPQYTVQYMPPGIGQPTNLPQMVPMPPTTMTATRVMAPPVAGQQHLEQGMQQGPGGQNAIFVSPPSGMQAQAAAAAAAHLGPPPGGAGQPHSHPAPTHMAPHHQPTPPHSQPSQHMNSQGAAGGGHPAPSPVQHQVTPGHPPPPQQAGQQVHTHPGPGQGHPASSGTPQPHLIYQQHGVPMSQQGHPPLQPSPHTPTSPQSMYPQTFVAASPFYATSQAPGMPQQQQQQQQQQQNAQQQQQQQPPGGGGPQLSSFTHTTPHTSVTHAHHQQQHSHMPHHGGGAPSQAPTGPQIVMMPHNAHPSHQQAVGNPGQLQHPQHASLQHTHQIPHHMAGMQGQAGHMIQQQAMGVPSANNLPHAQMHYQMHHHPQNLEAVYIP